MSSTVVDVDGVFVITGVAESAERALLEYFGKLDDGVQRGAQFVAHEGKEPGFHPILEFRLFLVADGGQPSLIVLDFKQDQKCDNANRKHRQNDHPKDPIVAFQQPPQYIVFKHRHGDE
jgi:hypothetical protein